MTSWKHRLETRMAYFSLALMKKPKLAMVVIVIILLGFGQSLRYIEVDSEMENFVDASAEVRVIYSQAKEQFGRNDVVMLGLRGKVLSTQFLTDMKALQDRIETELPYIDDVTSILNTPFQKGSEDSLEVLDLVGEIPQTQPELDQVEQRIQQSTLASSIMVNVDRSMALIMIEPATYDYGSNNSTSDEGLDDLFSSDVFSDVNAVIDASVSDLPFVTQPQLSEMLLQLDLILADYPDLNAIKAGMPAMNIALQHTMKTEMSFFIQLTIGLIALTLILFFRQLNAVVAPMLAVLMALLLTMSLLVITGNKIQVPLILLPSFLLAITIGDAVHLLTHFYRSFNSGESRLDAMFHAVQRTAIPMLLTSLTTAGGLLSLAIADVVPIRNLGIFAAIGVMLAFILTIVVIPVLVMLLPIRKAKTEQKPSLMKAGISRWSIFVWQHGGKLSLVWLVACLLAIPQIAKLNFSHDPMNWMPDNLEIVQSTRIIDQQLSGTMTLDIILDTGTRNGAKNLAFLRKVADWQERLEVYKTPTVEIKGVNSLVDVIKESNRALQGEGHNSLPQSQQLLNEELFLFENSAADQLYQLVDSDFQKLKVTLVLPWSDILYYEAFVHELQQQGDDIFGQDTLVQVTGLIALLAGTMVALVKSIAVSYMVAAGVIAIMMMLLLNSFRLGLLTMIPNIAPILVVMGLMHPFGIELDMLTMLVATIAIGIAVDNTVHFTHHFRHGLELGHDVETAMTDAFSGAGQALFTTCIVLTVGFYVFLFSEVHSIFNLGFLCGTAFLLAMISNFTLTPYLLRWYFKNNQQTFQTNNRAN
ncbi:MAG: putative RND superfamily exporter protein [Reinekea sp.]|jgi:predicted RND superfamily exporter protein